MGLGLPGWQCTRYGLVQAPAKRGMVIASTFDFLFQ